jgi:hypothetical protein
MDRRSWHLIGHAISVALILAIVIPAFGQDKQAAMDPETKEQPAAPTAVLYCVEFRGECGPPVMPSFLGEKILYSLAKGGIQVILKGHPPLVSREQLKYSMVATQAETALRRGIIYAEVGPGSELTFKNAEGKSIVLQIDVTEVCWDLDTGAAIAAAEKAGVDHALLARFQVEDLTKEINPNGEFGKQKSARVNLDLVAVDASTGVVVKAFSEDARQMDISTEGAIAKATRYLAEKAAHSWQKSGTETE